MTRLELPVSSQWTPLGRGYDSQTYLDLPRGLIKHVYDKGLSHEGVVCYAEVINNVDRIISTHPVQKSIGHFQFALDKVTPVVSVLFDDELGYWSTYSHFIAGPNLTSLHTPTTFTELCRTLADDEHSALEEFRTAFSLNPEYAYGLLDLLKSGTAMLRAKTKNSGIDLIFENAKLRMGKDRTHLSLMITDLTPSVEKVVQNHVKPR